MLIISLKNGDNDHTRDFLVKYYMTLVETPGKPGNTWKNLELNFWSGKPEKNTPFLCYLLFMFAAEI